MAVDFDNSVLRESCEKLREERNDRNLVRAAAALMDTKVLMPAKWDKDPEHTEDGKIRFTPDTKVSPMVVTNEKGTKLFPFFTNMEQLKKLYGQEPVNCIVMSVDQYLPMLEQAKDDVIGIVIDPAGCDTPFPTDFIKGFRENYRSPLRPKNVHQGQSLFLQNPTGDLQNMEAALISGGFHDKEINAIYLKERVEPDKPDFKPTWFILVDSSEKDTTIFTRLTEIVRPAAEGREIEFMFADSKLGRDIASTSKPIYQKTF